MEAARLPDPAEPVPAVAWPTVGVFFAGILFGALKAGGFSMQAAQGIPIDIVLIVQSIIVLLIAAPPLVRTIFRLPKPDEVVTPRRTKKSAEPQVVTK